MENDIVVLMTRCSRPENLQKICDSVVNLRSQLDDNGGKCIFIHHVIIFDKYKIDQTSLNKARNIVRLAYEGQISLNHLFEYRGGKDGANYGTTMIVDFCNNFMAYFYKDINPWMYILDDDNIIHPEFYKILLDHTNDDGVVVFGQRRKMDYFEGYESTPVLDSIITRENMYIGPDGNLTDDLYVLNSFDALRHPDSAQFIIRYDWLMANGNYEDVHYFIDHATIWKLYSTHPERFVFDTRVASYYNELLE